MSDSESSVVGKTYSSRNKSIARTAALYRFIVCPAQAFINLSEKGSYTQHTQVECRMDTERQHPRNHSEQESREDNIPQEGISSIPQGPILVYSTAQRVSEFLPGMKLLIFDVAQLYWQS